MKGLEHLRRFERLRRKDAEQADATTLAQRLYDHLVATGHAHDVIERTLFKWIAQQGLSGAQAHAIAQRAHIHLVAPQASGRPVVNLRARSELEHLPPTPPPARPWRPLERFDQLHSLAGRTRSEIAFSEVRHFEVMREANPEVSPSSPYRTPRLDGVRAPMPGVYALQMSARSDADSARTRALDLEPSAVLSTLGAGRPLPLAMRAELGPRLATLGVALELDAVRVHDDEAAAALCKELGARAFAVGAHVVLGESLGRDARHYALLAHELTHVWQQARGLAPAGIDASAALENDARRVERAVLAPPPGERPAEPSARAVLSASESATRPVEHSFQAPLALQRDPLPGQGPAARAPSSAGAREAATENPASAQRHWVVPTSGAHRELFAEAQRLMVRLTAYTPSALFIVTDRLYTYTTDGTPGRSWNITQAVPLPAGYYSNQRRLYDDGEGGLAGAARAVATPGQHRLTRWTSITEADVQTLTGGRDFLCVVGAQYVSSNEAGPSDANGIADRETRPGEASAERPPSASEFVPEFGAPSNVRGLGRAYRAVIEGPEVGAIGGESSFEMRLMIDNARDGRSALREADQIDRAHTLWEVFDVTEFIAGPGSSARQSAERRDGLRREVGRAAVGGGRFGRVDGSRLSAARRSNDRAADNFGEDFEGMAEDPSIARRAATLLTMPFQAVATVGRQILRGYGDWLETQHARTIAWPRAGHFFVRCVAQPMDSDRRPTRPASQASRLVEVRDPSRDARDFSEEADANIAELRLAAEAERDPAARARATQRVTDAELLAHGDAAAALRRRIALTREDLARATTTEVMRVDLLAQLRRLEQQLEHLNAQRHQLGGRPFLRVEAAHVDEVSGQRTELLLETTEPTGRPGHYTTELSDLTDRDGRRYSATAGTPLGAIEVACDQLVGAGLYARGWLSFALTFEGQRHRFLRRVRPREGALLRQGIQDLGAVAALIPAAEGLSVVAGLAGAAVSAENLYQRVRNGTLRVDQAAVSDVLGVLAAVASGLSSLGSRFGVGQSGSTFRVFLRDMGSVAGQSEGLIGHATLMVGMMALATELRQTIADEAAGRILPSQARRRRAEIALRGLRDGGLQIYGWNRQAEPTPEAAQAQRDLEQARIDRGEVGGLRAPVDDDGSTQQGRGTNGSSGSLPRPDQALQTLERVLTGAAPARSPTPGADSQRPRGAADHAMSAEHAARDSILATGDWKGELRQRVQRVSDPALRQTMENTLTEARRSLVAEVWGRVAAEFPGVAVFNPGTQSFASDIDITVRPAEQMPDFQGERRPIGEQIRVATEAAQRFRELLRQRIGGRETDVVIDTNVYAFIGESTGEGASNRDAIVASRPEDIRAASERQVSVGLAETRRGMDEQQWGSFRERMLRDAGALPGRSREQARRDLDAADAFHDARQRDWAQAANELGLPPGTEDAAQRRQIRERILQQKQAELVRLAGDNAEHQHTARIIELRSEILWFEPDAYASAPSVDQAVHILQSGGVMAANARQQAARTFDQVLAEARSELQAARDASPPDPQRVRRAEEAMGHIDHERQLRETAATQETLVDTLAGSVRAMLEAMRTGPANQRARLARELRTLTRDLQAATAEYTQTRRDVRRLEQRRGAAAELRGVRDQANRTQEIMVGSGMNERERAGHSLAAATSNLGMLRGHSAPDHSTPGDAVKAAGKYGARILFAVLQASPNTTPRDTRIIALLRAFSLSRSHLMSGSAPAAFMRETVLEHARNVGLERGTSTEAEHFAAAQRRFAADIGAWAESEVSRLHQIYATLPTRELRTTPTPGAERPG
jgi:hypothetical protein